MKLETIIDTIIERMRDKFVTIEVFNLRITPMEKLLYGAVVMMITAVFAGLLALVIKGKGGP